MTKSEGKGFAGLELTQLDMQTHNTPERACMQSVDPRR